MYFRVLRAINIVSLFLLALSCGMLVAKFAVARFVAVAVVVLWFLASRQPGRSTAYGSAMWAQMQHLRRELEPGPGIGIGTLLGAKISRLDGLRALLSPGVPSAYAVRRYLTSCMRRQPPVRVRLNDSVHTCVIAPTGAGKGTGLVVPYLLECPDSMVVVDIKGENYQLTAAHRARQFCQKIIVLDPFNVVTHD